MSTDGGYDIPSLVSGRSLGLIQRVDRLDHVLSELEDKAADAVGSSCLSTSVSHCDGRSVSCPPTPSGFEKRFKHTESILVEVEKKGTLFERVSHLEKRVSMLGESLRLAHSRRPSELDDQPDATLSFPLNKAEKTRHASCPDIPTVEEKREVSPSKYDLGPAPEMPAHHDVGKLDSETEYCQDIQEKVHEETEHREPEQCFAIQGTKRDEEACHVPFDKFEKGLLHRWSYEKKAKSLRRWFSKSFKRVSSGVHKPRKGNGLHASKHCWSSPCPKG